jgi:hypothetical protein
MYSNYPNYHDFENPDDCDLSYLVLVREEFSGAGPEELIRIAIGVSTIAHEVKLSVLRYLCR